MTKNQIDAILTFITAMAHMLMGFIALTAGNTFTSICAVAGAVYYLMLSHLEYSKQKYDTNGKPV